MDQRAKRPLLLLHLQRVHKLHYLFAIFAMKLGHQDHGAAVQRLNNQAAPRTYHLLFASF